MWFKVDDGFCMNPKTAMLSNDATALWLRSGTWAAQQLTKGRVPANMIPMFRCSDDSVQELCDAGLWEYDADKDEYVFHDWADYQPDGDEVDEAVGAARSKADFYHRAYVVRTAYESPARTIRTILPRRHQ